MADVFCTRAEGFRARDALEHELVDGAFARSKWAAGIQQVAADVVASSPARATAGITLDAVVCDVGEQGSRAYKSVQLDIDRAQRVATITMNAPTVAAPAYATGLRNEGSNTWSFRALREFEDALFHLRFNFPEIGLILLKTRGDAAAVLAHDAVLQDNAGDWLANEVRLLQARILRRIDNTARSVFAIIDEGSCFVGSLFEQVIAADRSYMLEDEDGDVTVQLTAASGGMYPMSTGITRLQARFVRHADKVAAALDHGAPVDGPDAYDMGLVTMAPDDIDWDDEIRIAIEERVSLSPDALTGMEQNLRFVGAETCDSKIFGRLSAWQNWIFQRPNAVGDEGALTLYGHPTRPRFDWNRT
jgi:benzoyl-CoA-dihydrodiol lyase